MADAAGPAECYTGELRKIMVSYLKIDPRVPGFQAIGRSGLS